jgi:hypothetical protein
VCALCHAKFTKSGQRPLIGFARNLWYNPYIT